MAAKKDTRIYQLKITLKDISPPIWRRLLVPENITLPELHTLIQNAFGWQDCHLHLFDVNDEQYGVPDSWGIDEIPDESGKKLNGLLAFEKCSMLYTYDFGDTWEHSILLEKILPADPAQKLPVCIKGKRACPPEDCGGPWSYENLLEILADPKHEEHKDVKEWTGGDFDPEEFNLDEINASLGHK